MSPQNSARIPLVWSPKNSAITYELSGFIALGKFNRRVNVSQEARSVASYCQLWAVPLSPLVEVWQEKHK